MSAVSQPNPAVTDEDIRRVSMANGFAVKDGQIHATPQPQAATGELGEPLFLLHCGALFGGERDEWDVEANSGRAVDALADQHPGKTLDLYNLTPDEVAAVNRHRARRKAAQQPAPQERRPLTGERILELAEDFGSFEYGDAQGDKRLDFGRAIERACAEAWGDVYVEEIARTGRCPGCNAEEDAANATGITATTQQSEEKPRCTTRGMLAGGMCGHVLVGGKHCGFGGACVNKATGSGEAE